MLDKNPKIISLLNRNKVEYVIIGGYAIIIHGFLRATEDIDIVLKMTNENVSKFQKALLTIYNDNDINEINFSELSNYSVIRYGTPDNYYIDVISKIGESFNYDNISKENKIIDGIEFITATAESLYEMKKNTYREKDKLDILFLKEKLGK
ncbi:MAG: hypothetical protein K8F60_02555 [Melioribacteraceae bacterium]|nr:hypothetical protein [Melioribacteraceae bacterium]